MSCPQCPLSETLEATLSMFRGQKEMTATMARSLLPDVVGVTAFNNRLERLRARGHLRRHRVGHEWRYSLAQGQN